MLVQTLVYFASVSKKMTFVVLKCGMMTIIHDFKFILKSLFSFYV